MKEGIQHQIRHAYSCKVVSFSCLLLCSPFILPLLSSHVLSCHWAFSCFSSLLLSLACLPLHYHWVSVMSSTWITLFSAWRVVASGMPRGKGRTRQDKTNTSQSQSQHNATQQKTKSRQAQKTELQRHKKSKRQEDKTFSNRQELGLRSGLG